MHPAIINLINYRAEIGFSDPDSPASTNLSSEDGRIMNATRMENTLKLEYFELVSGFKTGQQDAAEHVIDDLIAHGELVYATALTENERAHKVYRKLREVVDNLKMGREVMAERDKMKAKP